MNYIYDGFKCILNKVNMDKLLEDVNKPDDNKVIFFEDKECLYVYPALLAFTVELSLKLLIHKEGECKKSIKTHKLTDLFNCLKGETKEKIIKNISMDCLDKLKYHNDSFERWRYAYEYGELSFDGEFMNKLLLAIDKEIEMHKNALSGSS